MIYPLSTEVREPIEVLGAKAHGLVTLLRLGLPVPPGFVIPRPASPQGLDAAIDALEVATGRRLGDPDRPLTVSVRSGSTLSMPGMMSTILNVGLTLEALGGLAAGAGEFAYECRRRLVASHAEVAEDGRRQVEQAVEAVVSSWDTPRARMYRELNGIPHDLGTAVIVQAMVFGNRDVHSGSGVAFSRDPTTGEAVPYGEVLFGHQGEDVVSGRSLTRPLGELADREPAAWADLLDALARVEAYYRDACYLEFTIESGRLWLLQARPGRFGGEAAVRVATDLADAGTIDRREALLRVSPRHLAPIERVASGVVLARGIGAGPGVATGAVATSADAAIRMVAEAPVILVRPETSPLDLPGLAAAVGVVTARGGPVSHAAIVARSMGRPAVVGVADLVVVPAAFSVGRRTIGEGTLITVDGTSGAVYLGAARVVTGESGPHLCRLLEWADAVSGDRSPRADADRLRDAQAVLGVPADR
jgi:pyruvate,orthophosphate dikinase